MPLDLIRDVPDREGFWEALKAPADEPMVLEIYPLDPVGGTLCFWGPDVGLNYTGATETQGVWMTDEWQGHIPVFVLNRPYDAGWPGPWRFLGKEEPALAV
jgi:hypothetical protein